MDHRVRVPAESSHHARTVGVLAEQERQLVEPHLVGCSSRGFSSRLPLVRERQPRRSISLYIDCLGDARIKRPTASRARPLIVLEQPDLSPPDATSDYAHSLSCCLGGSEAGARASEAKQGSPENQPRGSICRTCADMMWSLACTALGRISRTLGPRPSRPSLSHKVTLSEE